MTGDLDLFTIVVIVCFGFVGAVLNKGWCFRTGSVLSSIITCVGFGFCRRLFFGGHLDAGTYCGCLMLALGVTAWLLFRGISMGLQRLENACLSSKREPATTATGDPQER